MRIIKRVIEAGKALPNNVPQKKKYTSRRGTVFPPQFGHKSINAAIDPTLQDCKRRRLVRD